MNICPHCQYPLATPEQLKTHIELKHREQVPIHLMALYLDAKANPDDQGKRLVYFEALADARLSDYYALRDDLRAAYQQIDAIKHSSDVSNLFDGADHLNEHTHEANEKHLTAALDKIHAIANGAKFDWIGGIPVLDDTDDGTIPDHLYEADGKWYPRVPDTDPAARGQT